MQSIDWIVSNIKEWCKTHKDLVNDIDPKVLCVDIGLDMNDCMEALDKIVSSEDGSKFIGIECPFSCGKVNFTDQDSLNEKTECDNCAEVYTPNNYIDTNNLIGFRFCITKSFFENKEFNPTNYIKNSRSEKVINMSEIKQINKIVNKTKKIFISHCSANKEIAGKLVSLLEDIGVDSQKIYYSSFEDTGAKLLSDCLESIVDQFNKYDLLVVFLISKEFYKSDVCLAEAGATWISVGKNYIPIILPPYNYGNLGGVIRESQNSIELINTDNMSGKIENLRSVVKEFIGIEDMQNQLEWDRKKNNFINYIKVYNESISAVDTKLKDITLKNDKIIFKVIIKNNTKNRVKIDEMAVNISIKNSEQIEIKIGEDILHAMVIKPFEDIEIYLPERSEKNIKRSAIEIEKCKIIIKTYNED